MQGRELYVCDIVKKKLCLGLCSVNLNEIWYAATTCWFVEADAKFTSQY